MIRYTIRYYGQFVGFSTAESAAEALEKFSRFNPTHSTKGLTAARPVN